MKVVGYGRCSTAEQAANGVSIEVQRRAVERAAEANGWEMTWLADEGVSGGCVAMTYITKAATRGVDIQELEVTIEATVDLRGIFELAAVRAGLAGARVTVRVRSSANDAALEELRQLVTRTSAVYDSLTNPVPIQMSLQRLT
jgi:OsmC-like protein/Resolvase, N terminal domain